MTEQKKEKPTPTAPVDPVTKLQVPITFGGKVVTELTMRRAKVKDLAAMERAEAQAERDGVQIEIGVVTVAQLTDQPVELIHELDIEDFLALQEKAGDFFPEQVLAAAKAAKMATGNVSGTSGGAPSQK